MTGVPVTGTRYGSGVPDVVGDVDHTFLTELAEWASTLELADVPDRVAGIARSHILSHLAAIRVGLRHENGRRLVRALGEPLQPDLAGSCRVLAGAGAWLNLDDTAYAGHLGPSTVAVPVAHAYALGLSGAELLRSVVVANECAARITAAATLGPFRGQTALHTHLIGTVAGRLSSLRARPAVWANAFALALSAPPWTLLRGFITSDARLLHVPGAVRGGWDACEAAAAGLTGPLDVLEHPDGFLARYSAVPLPEVVTAGLGERWHTETLSVKLHPGGPGIDAAIDCAADLHHDLGDFLVDDVRDVLVEASLYTVHVARLAEAYVDGPRTPVGALVLTCPYPVATALITGGLTIDDFAGPAVLEPERWALAEKVRLVHDAEMTRTLFSGDAPFGEAVRQAGSRATTWVHGFGGEELVDLVGTPGPPLDSFRDATKPTPARVTVRLADGTRLRRSYTIPRGGIGEDFRRHHAAIVADKYVHAGGDRGVAESWPSLAEHPPSRLAENIRLSLAGPVPGSPRS